MQSIWENQHPSMITYTWCALKENVRQAKILRTITESCSNCEFPRVELKNLHTPITFIFPHGLMTWLVMQRSVWNDIVSWQIGRLSNSTAPCIDDHHFKEEETKSVEELSKVWSQIVLKCLNLARIGRPVFLWSVNKLARSITKWTKVCDKRLSWLISYIHHTSECKQYCHVRNTAKQCRLGLFPRLRFCRRSWEFKIYIRRNIVCFWKSYICSNQLDV